jgi:hypothetical protein
VEIGNTNNISVNFLQFLPLIKLYKTSVFLKEQQNFSGFQFYQSLAFSSPRLRVVRIILSFKASDVKEYSQNPNSNL